MALDLRCRHGQPNNFRLAPRLKSGHWVRPDRGALQIRPAVQDEVPASGSHVEGSSEGEQIRQFRL